TDATEKGTLEGAAIGTGVGALIGRGHPGAMLIGGALGAASGAVAGNAQNAACPAPTEILAVWDQRIRFSEDAVNERTKIAGIVGRVILRSEKDCADATGTLV